MVGHTERYAMYAMYALYVMFATPSGHTGCDSYETRHLHKMMAAVRLPWESDDSDDEVLLLYANSSALNPYLITVP